jgi:hypothetical protein
LGDIEGFAHMPTALDLESVKEECEDGNDLKAYNSSLSFTVSVFSKEEDNRKKPTKNSIDNEEEENPFLAYYSDDDKDYLQVNKDLNEETGMPGYYKKGEKKDYV